MLYGEKALVRIYYESDHETVRTVLDRVVHVGAELGLESFGIR